jgi:sporulation protein YlmC with PRC-barrel domain
MAETEKPVLGKNLRDKKVVSASGLDLGTVADAFYETGGKLVSILVKPERELKEIRDHLDKDGFLEVPFEEVKAIGRYVVVNFPFERR